MQHFLPLSLHFFITFPKQATNNSIVLVYECDTLVEEHLPFTKTKLPFFD